MKRGARAVRHRPKAVDRTTHARARGRATTVARASQAARERSLTVDEVGLLRRGGIAPEDFARVRPDLREAAALYDDLLAISFTVGEAAARLGVDPSRIRQRLAARTLYGVRAGQSWRLPRFQFCPTSGVVPGIEKVIARLPADLSPVAVHRWFTLPHVDLTTRDDAERPLSPLEWLQTGHSPLVAAALAAEL